MVKSNDGSGVTGDVVATYPEAPMFMKSLQNCHAASVK
jgi:hypothetical protein